MGRFLKLLVCLSFAVRSLLPVGFMLAAAPDHSGSLQIVICTGHGPETLVLDEKGVPQPSKSSSADKNTCPFAAGGTTTVAAQEPLTLAHAVRYASVTYALATEIFRATPKPRAHFARGPPLLVI